MGFVMFGALIAFLVCLALVWRHGAPEIDAHREHLSMRRALALPPGAEIEPYDEDGQGELFSWKDAA